MLNVIALTATGSITIRLMQIPIAVVPHLSAIILLDSTIRLWLWLVALLRWVVRLLWLLLLLLLLLVAHGFEAFVCDTEEGAVFDAVFD